MKIILEFFDSMEKLPPIKDKWYLFGGYDNKGHFVFDKYHYSISGMINGWNLKTARKNGITHWASIEIRDKV
jgi:hypothetical protein